MLSLLIILMLTSTVLSCTDYDECIKNPPKLESFPVTEEKIHESCRQYEEYQSCAMNWADRCLQGLNRIEFEMMIGKSIEFLRTLCTNNTFKTEYMKEKASFEKINNEWSQCQNSLLNSIKDVRGTPQDRKNEKAMMELCCSTDKFMGCVDTLCNNKCAQNGTIIYRDILDMIRRGFESLNCDTITYKTECKNASVKMSLNTILLALVIVYQIFI